MVKQIGVRSDTGVPLSECSSNRRTFEHSPAVRDSLDSMVTLWSLATVLLEMEWESE